MNLLSKLKDLFRRGQLDTRQTSRFAVVVMGVRTLRDVVDASLMQERLIAQLAGFFSVLH